MKSLALTESREASINWSASYFRDNLDFILFEYSRNMPALNAADWFTSARNTKSWALKCAPHFCGLSIVKAISREVFDKLIEQPQGVFPEQNIDLEQAL